MNSLTYHLSGKITLEYVFDYQSDKYLSYIRNKGKTNCPRKLFDNRGHNFDRKILKSPRFKAKGQLTCSTNKRKECTRLFNCRAKVIYNCGRFFLFGGHQCTPNYRMKAEYVCRNSISIFSLKHRFERYSFIEQLVLDELKKQNLISFVPNLVHQVHYNVATFRPFLDPPNPFDLNFRFDEPFIPPNYLRGEIVMTDPDYQRHLIFATDSQLSLLKRAIRWYVDIYPQFVNPPFRFLLVITVLMSKEEKPTPPFYQYEPQPLVHVFMSRGTSDDYEAVFEKLLKLINHDTCVEEMVCDFELPLWRTVQAKFPHVYVSGCALYNWLHRISGLMWKLELGYLYHNHPEGKKLLVRLVILPLVPAKQIPKILSMLKKRAQQIHLGNHYFTVEKVINYIETNWVYNPDWPIRSWCAFGEPFRQRATAVKTIVNSTILKPRNKSVDPSNFYTRLHTIYMSSIDVPDNREMLHREQLLARPLCKHFSLLYYFRKQYQRGKIKSLQMLKRSADVVEDPRNRFGLFSLNNNPFEKFLEVPDI